jgi:cytochrome oxidase Cu insertion factor (SCO1/SenC/PrrC family)
MLKIQKNTLTLILLTVIFIAPSVVAIIAYNYRDAFNNKTTNHGTFMKEEIYFKDISQNKKWHIAYYNYNKCDNSCMQQLDKLARIRLALGRHLYNIDAYLLKNKNQTSLSKQKTKFLRNVDINVVLFSVLDTSYNNLFGEKSAFYLINPDNYIVLTYKDTSSADDIYQDIKKLVKD